ncbi:MAG: hypothetical protein M8467_20755 [Anaerolineae bacterium]|nr:hypothetical protein [Anaerolineae bacterium]
MAEREGLVKVVQRLATDEEFRRRLMVTPREVMMVELGISGEAYDALLSIVPVLLAGGLLVAGGGTPPDSNTIDSPTWGSWG